MSDPIRAWTTSVEQTREVAGAIAGLVESGDVIVLGGDLGAGKTAFVQGLGRDLGIEEHIVSPTFTIERIYDGRVRLHHLDVYRLDHLHEALDLGLAEALDDGDVAVVEWGDAILSVLGFDYLHIALGLGDADDERTLELTPHGERWAARYRSLADALASWPCGDTRPPETEGH